MAGSVPANTLGPLIADQWRLIEAYSRTAGPRDEGQGGRPRADDRECLEAVLWAMLTGNAGRGWKNLPAQYPSPATCARRLAQWRAGGIWLEALWRAVQLGSDAQERKIAPGAAHLRGGR